MANNALQVRQQAHVPANQMTDAQVELVKRTIAKGADDDELLLFLEVAKRHGLDPFKREIFFVKDNKGRVTHITSRDGYLTIAQQHPDYAGMISGVVKAGDTFEIDTTQGSQRPVIHKFGASRGAIIGAWAVVHRRGSSSHVAYVEFADYNKPGRDGRQSVWDQYPSAMIEKVAQSRALKFAFGVSGLVTQEEMGYSTPRPQEPQTRSRTVSVEPIEQSPGEPRPTVTAEQLQAEIVEAIWKGGVGEPEEADDDTGGNPLSDYLMALQRATTVKEINDLHKGLLATINRGDLSLTEQEHNEVYEAYNERRGKLRQARS